jgi:hypothetical protein
MIMNYSFIPSYNNSRLPSVNHQACTSSFWYLHLILHMESKHSLPPVNYCEILLFMSFNQFEIHVCCSCCERCLRCTGNNLCALADANARKKICNKSFSRPFQAACKKKISYFEIRSKKSTLACLLRKGNA